MLTLKDSIEYNKKREAEHILFNIKQSRNYGKELTKLYKKTNKNIKDEIETFIGKYANQNGISIEDTKKIVSQLEVDEYSKKAQRYIKENNFSTQANQEMKIYNLTIKTSRFELLEKKIDLELIAMADKEDKMLKRELTLKIIETAERQSGLLGGTMWSQKELEAVTRSLLNSSFYSARFSERIWMNKAITSREINRKLAEHLQQAIIRGKNPKTWYKDMRQYLNKGLRADIQKANYNSLRLAVTETARVQMEIQIETLNRNDYEKYIWIAEPTACPICAEFANMVFTIKEAEMGGNLPPLHPWCRCSIAGYQDL